MNADLHHLSGAYAVDALDDAERTAFEQHLAGCTEPGRVFAELAAVCVPALCDDVIVDMQEDGGHRYRIRRPGSSPAAGVIAGAAARPGRSGRRTGSP